MVDYLFDLIGALDLRTVDSKLQPHPMTSSIVILGLDVHQNTPDRNSSTAHRYVPYVGKADIPAGSRRSRSS